MICCGYGNSQTRSVAFTFDDLPISGRTDSFETMKSVNDDILAVLRLHKIPATGFVNEQKLFYPGEIDRRTALLEQWLADGHDLGNHTYSHIAINSSTFEEYMEDLIRGETVTRVLLEKRGKPLRYFRHTQLRTGPTDDFRSRLNQLLESRGYRTAPVTIDSNEYLFASRYSEAKARSDSDAMEKIVSAYIVYMEQITAHFEGLSKGFLGYEVKQTLLLHANELNADHLGKLVEMFKRRGYSFISLDEALADSAYALPEVTSRRGLSWIHRWMLSKGFEMREEPSVPDWIQQ